MSYIKDNFLLTNKTAEKLYFNYAKDYVRRGWQNQRKFLSGSGGGVSKTAFPFREVGN